MKPTQEQVIAWARAVADKDKVDPINSMGDMITLMLHEFSNAMSLAYEAGRKDENEACAKEVAAIDADGWEFNMAAIIRARIETNNAEWNE